jgi:hypothetical protein
MQGNECQWDDAASKCILKSAVDWKSSDHCNPSNQLWLEFSGRLPGLASLIAGILLYLYAKRIK